MSKNETLEALKSLQKHCEIQRNVASLQDKMEKVQVYGEMYQRITSLVERLESHDNLSAFV